MTETHLEKAKRASALIDAYKGRSKDDLYGYLERGILEALISIADSLDVIAQRQAA